MNSQNLRPLLKWFPRLKHLTLHVGEKVVTLDYKIQRLATPASEVQKAFEGLPIPLRSLRITGNLKVDSISDQETDQILDMRCLTGLQWLETAHWMSCFIFARLRLPQFVKVLKIWLPSWYLRTVELNQAFLSDLVGRVHGDPSHYDRHESNWVVLLKTWQSMAPGLQRIVIETTSRGKKKHDNESELCRFFQKAGLDCKVQDLRP